MVENYFGFMRGELGNKAVNAFIGYSTAGLQLAIVLVLCVYGGYRLDLKLNSSPAFVVTGAILGMGIGLYNLLRGLKEVDRILREEKGGSETKRRKWL